MEEENLLTTSEVAVNLNITIPTVKIWMRKGILPAKRNRFGWWVFDPKDVESVKNRMKPNRSGRTLLMK